MSFAPPLSTIFTGEVVSIMDRSPKRKRSTEPEAEADLLGLFRKRRYVIEGGGTEGKYPDPRNERNANANTCTDDPFIIFKKRSNAASRVFEIYDLVFEIVLCLPPEDIIRFSLVSRITRSVILRKAVQAKLYYISPPGFDTEAPIFMINPLLHLVSLSGPLIRRSCNHTTASWRQMYLATLGLPVKIWCLMIEVNHSNETYTLNGSWKRV
jgi:hypothetical protein